MWGEGGDDIMDGADGSDHMWGGAGFDMMGGGDGEDYIWAGESGDFALGGDGSDQTLGGGGNDLLVGDKGNDGLYGGADDDTLMGSEGADKLVGGEGQDTFAYGGLYNGPAVEESPATSAGSDQILDFQYGTDKIEFKYPEANAGPGTPENYHSASTNATSMDEAAQEASQNYGPEDRLTYLYLANEKTDTGYLLADLDGNGNFETGITLVGNGGPGEFGYDAIV
jgi:Ca2+-binding RTX toxin-like protein